MKRVYICSPLKGNVSKNIIKANLYCRYAYEQGYLPLAPHVIFTEFLDDEVSEEREAGMKMGLELLWVCDELWVFGYRITEGMAKEIEIAKGLKIRIRYFDEHMEER